VTTVATGLIAGLGALQWPDLDLDGGTVHFRRNLSWARLPGEEVRPRFFRPKTTAGIRKVPLAPELVHALELWKLQCPASPDQLVFPTAEGTPMRRDVVLRSGLYPALKRAKLRRVDMHSLRPSFASALIAQGAPVTEVQAYLGHSLPTTTLKVYSQWFNTVKTDAIERLGRCFLENGHLVDT
jgi:integrase